MSVMYTDHVDPDVALKALAAEGADLLGQQTLGQGRCHRAGGSEEKEPVMAELLELDRRLRLWSVPDAVGSALRAAVKEVEEDGAKVTEGITDDYLSLAASGKPIAVYVGRTRVSIALDPEEAETAQRADAQLALEKDSSVTWFLHCSYTALTVPQRVEAVRTLILQALHRSVRNVRDAGLSNREERRRAAAAAAIPRCPVPGCNMPMVGGSCGFHD
jgi:hypothetical protein